MREGPGIETLLDLHDQIIDQGDGYWVKIEAWRIASTAEVTHGIRYSLTAARAVRQANPPRVRQRACGRSAEEVQVRRPAAELRP
jgi:hypothetical protein